MILGNEDKVDGRHVLVVSPVNHICNSYAMTILHHAISALSRSGSVCWKVSNSICLKIVIISVLVKDCLCFLLRIVIWFLYHVLFRGRC